MYFKLFNKTYILRDKFDEFEFEIQILKDNNDELTQINNINK